MSHDEKTSIEKASNSDHGANKPYHLMSVEEKTEAMKAAVAMDPGVPRWSLTQFYIYFIVLATCFCSGDSGFDGTVMGGINTMKQYQQYFKLTEAGPRTGIVFGIFTIGSLCGTIPAAYLPDKFGRRWSMFFGNAVLIVGAILTANAQNPGMFLGGRFLTGFGASCAGASAKSYLAEMAPPQHRGAYLGFLNSFYYVGQMSATGMMVATGKYQNEWSWRLPLYIQVVPAAGNVLTILFCPESPRWLYVNGQADKARQILANLHSSNKDINSPVVELEMAEIVEHVKLDGADKRWWDFRPLFRTRADRYRTYLVIMVGAFGQLSGNGLITYFLPILLGQAGINDQNKRLTLNFVNSVTSYIGALSGSFIIDRVGRRKLVLISTGTITLVLVIVTGLLSNPSGNKVRADAGISFIYLFMVIFSFGWTPMQALYPAEVLGYQVRAKGLAFLGICTQTASLINTFGLPVALERLTWKTYIIFVVWDTFEFIMVYFFFVETKQLSLEEIDEVFEAKHPRKYGKQLQIRRKAAGVDKTSLPSGV